jgi:hypothetical protein
MQLSISSFIRFLLTGISLACNALADGLPYGHNEGGGTSMHCDFIAVGLSDKQMRQISATGVAELDDKQLRLLRSFYSDFPAKAAVASSTTNDGLERAEAVADVIWWYSHELRIPLWVADKGEKIAMPDAEPWTPDSENHFRLSPEGQLFHMGKLVTLQEAQEVIDRIAKKPRASPGEDDGHISLTVPPRAQREHVSIDDQVIKQLPQNWPFEDTTAVILKIRDFLSTYARSKGIELYYAW